MRGGTNLPRVGDFNRQVVLESIRREDGVSRVEIARETGLTAQTVSNIVRRLLMEGFVVEAGKGPPKKGGKPRVKLKVNPEAGYALGVQIDRDEVSLVLLDLDGRTVQHSRNSLPYGQVPDEIVEVVAGLVKELVKSKGVGAKVLGLGVASPGPLDPASGVLHGPPGFAGWTEVPIKKLLEDRIGYPVLVDNDAIAAAVGERWAGKARGVDNFAFVYTGWGVGAGLFVEGHVYRGATGTAGELGHVPLDPNGPECQCGNRGCLIRYCSPREISSAVEKRLLSGENSTLSRSWSKESAPLNLAAIRVAAMEGDRVATDELEASGRRLSQAVVGMVNLLDLQMVVLGGKALGEAAGIYQRQVAQALREYVLYRDRREIRTEISASGADAGAVGAASVILHSAYTPQLARLRSA